MKKLIIIFVIALSSYGCNRCQTCEQTTTTSYSFGGSATVKKMFSACGQELRDKKVNKTYSSSIGGGAKMTTKITTKCN